MAASGFMLAGSTGDAEACQLCIAAHDARQLVRGRHVLDMSEAIRRTRGYQIDDPLGATGTI